MVVWNYLSSTFITYQEIFCLNSHISLRFYTVILYETLYLMYVYDAVKCIKMIDTTKDQQE